MDLSNFTKQLAVSSGIGRLMDDLGRALASDQEYLMLGGGNPAHIPEVQTCFREAMADIVQDRGCFARMIGNYDPPEGSRPFAGALCRLLQERYGWAIGPENVALTNGSQSAFFALFNLLAGSFAHGQKKRILLPLTPEYIGYCDLGLEPDLFVSARPKITYLEPPWFKYHVDFDRIETILERDSIGALCVSRPTNPTGNVLTNDEISRLNGLAETNDIPLILDNAYGLPFPGIVFVDAKPVWTDHTIVCMSLSKLGLPGTRTGIVMARSDLIETLARLNAIVSLAPGSIGATLVTPLLQNGRLLSLAREIIRPFYEAKALHISEILKEALNGLNFFIHKPEGAFFVWLWLPDMKITSLELYERLKSVGVIVVPGEYFFPGLDTAWEHTTQCIRINYAQDEAVVKEGVRRMAPEIKQAH